MEKIAEAAVPPDEKSYRECEKFSLRREDMVRSVDKDLLISMRRKRFHPKPVMIKGNMTLYQGPFGGVFGCYFSLTSPMVLSKPDRRGACTTRHSG